MKRLISAVLAMSLLGATAAAAAPVNHGTPVQYRSDNYRHRDNGDNAALAAGIGFLALAAILSSQNNHQPDRWNDRNWDHSGYGYDRGNGNSYRGYDRGNDHRGW
jgi:hypothetical protein